MKVIKLKKVGPYSGYSLAETVDALGRVKAELAPLLWQEKKLTDALKEAYGEGVHLGEAFEANIFGSGKTTVDYKTIFRKAKVPSKLIAENTKFTPGLTCKVTPRK